MGWGRPATKPVPPEPKRTPKSVVTAMDNDKPSFDMLMAVARTYLKALADARTPIHATEQQQAEFERKVADAKRDAELILNNMGLGQHINFEG